MCVMMVGRLTHMPEILKDGPRDALCVLCMSLLRDAPRMSQFSTQCKVLEELVSLRCSRDGGRSHIPELKLSLAVGLSWRMLVLVHVSGWCWGFLPWPPDAVAFDITDARLVTFDPGKVLGRDPFGAWVAATILTIWIHTYMAQASGVQRIHFPFLWSIWCGYHLTPLAAAVQVCLLY